MWAGNNGARPDAGAPPRGGESEGLKKRAQSGGCDWPVATTCHEHVGRPRTFPLCFSFSVCSLPTNDSSGTGRTCVLDAPVYGRRHPRSYILTLVDIEIFPWRALEYGEGEALPPVGESGRVIHGRYSGS